MDFKIAIFTDIHANTSALKVILSDAIKEGCVELIHLGDSIAIGPEPSEALELLFENHVKLIMGNHEQYYLEKGENLPRFIHDEELEHQRWTYHEIGDERIEVILELPYRIDKNIDGHRLAFMHYPARNVNGNIEFKDFLRDMSYQNVDEFFDVKADLVFFGHDHNFIDLHSELTGTRYINPGSAGCSKDDKTRYTILTFNDNGYSVTHKKISYNKVNMIDKLREKEVPAAEFIITAFYGG